MVCCFSHLIIYIVVNREQNLEREKSTHIYSRQGEMFGELATMQQLEQSMVSGRKSNGKCQQTVMCISACLADQEIFNFH
jgi:hypothetical protein